MNRAPRLPAFGRQLLDARRRGEIPVLGYSIALDNWNNNVTGRCVVPNDTSVDELSFPFVAGSDVCVISGEDCPRAREVLTQVLRFNPSRLILLVGEKIDWIKSKKHGVEVHP